ncbi:MAG: hypothetical protein OEL76_09035 [Siculibacillus sp.]|nr:hypothetical protein [Siculibacillus sp.]
MYVTSHDIAEGRGCRPGAGRRHRRGAGCVSATEILASRSLTDAQLAAVHEALDDEYRAFAYYSAVLERFPNAMPFAHIVDAEARHAAALAGVLRAHGHAVPPNPHIGSPEVRAAVPASVACACDIAVEAEIDNVGLYVDRLLPAVADRDDLVAVFTWLMEASRDRHLPAFRRWTAGQRFKGGIA